ncbi:MAG TPA: hypothetical protein VFH33_07815 [Candidatus Krumholzibacteria bacterium]|nr:hypothetical protein [Candidatus Krumholzibacteria bacterium]
MEYRSRASVLGLPLIHIALGSARPGEPYRRGIATGWIAIGDIARGVLVASGGVAVGGICIGGVGLGLISFAGMSVGALAFGGMALGYYAVGGAAFAWQVAIGGLAVSHAYALGGVGKAPHVITPQPGGPFPLSSIPHAPFRTGDAIIFVVLLMAVLIFSLTMRQRSRE